MKIPAALRGRQNIVIDTMIFIYLFENSLQYGAVCEFLVEQAGKGLFSAVVTPITAAEVLVKPLTRKREDIADRYRNALRGMKNIRPVDLSFDTGHMAGALRSKYRLPLPDMIQVACAFQAERPAIITNDEKLRKVEEVHIFLLEDFM